MASPLNPNLEPKSSKKFFGKDYPVDHHPVADEHYKFGHPYPAVMDSSDYDSDFVKDENSDGGKWDAQMNYDILRQKVTAADKEPLTSLALLWNLGGGGVRISRIGSGVGGGGGWGQV